MSRAVQTSDPSAVAPSHSGRQTIHLNGYRFGFEENPCRFFIDDVLLSGSQLTTFLSDFDREYQLIRDGEKVFIKFRGDILDRLGKIAGDIDKIKYLIGHAFKEQKNRTNQALKKVLLGTAWVVSQSRPVVLQSAAAAVSVLTPLVVEAESEPVPARKKYPFVDAVDYFLNQVYGTLLFDRVISDPKRFTTALKNYHGAPDDEKLQMVTVMLSCGERDAIECLRTVEFSRDFSEAADKETLAEERAALARQHQIASYYLLLKAIESRAPAFLAFEQKVQDAKVILSDASVAPENFLGREVEVGAAFCCLRMVLGEDDALVAAFLARIRSIQSSISEVKELFDSRHILTVNIDEVQARFLYAVRFITMIAGEDHSLKEKVNEAKAILDAALTSFDVSNAYFFGPQDSSRAAQEKNEALLKKVVSAYLFLKVVCEADVLAHYNQLIKKVYAHYLHYQVRAGADRKMVCNDLPVELFLRSGLFQDVRAMSVHSAHRTQGASVPTLFVRRESGSEAFEADCRKRWVQLPLAALQEAALIEPRRAEMIFSSVIQSGRSDIDRHYQERVFYLFELISEEKFDEAESEARAFHAVFSEALMLRSMKPNPLYNFLYDALSKIVDAIRFRIIDDIKRVLNQHRDGESLLNEADKVLRKRDAALSEIIELLLGRYSGLASKIHYLRTPLTYGLTNTHALKNIAESVLRGDTFQHSQLVALDPDEYMNYYPCVWVGDDAERDTLLVRLSDAQREMLTGNPSYFELFQGLYRCISKMNPISVMTTVGAQIEGSHKTVSVDDVAKPLLKEDVALMNRGAVGASYAMDLLEAAFKPLWEYGPTKRAITLDGSGNPAFKPKAEARTFISDPDTNFFKYEKLIMFYETLTMLRRNFSHTDVVRHRDYHQKITRNFVQLFRLIDSVREEVKLKGEDGKTFDKLVDETFKNAVGLAQASWLEYCDRVTHDARLDQHHQHEPYRRW